REILLQETARQIQSFGAEALIVPTDVTDQSQVERLVREVLKQWGRIDILVSNAGQYIRKPIVDITIDDIQRSMAVNYYAGVYAILAVLPHMCQRGSGHIIMVSSMDGKKGVPPDAPYASAKFATTGFAEVLRQELYGTGVDVSNIFPGRVDTPFVENLQFSWISKPIQPENVAKAVVTAIQKKRPEVLIPFRARLLHYANVFSPRLGDWAVRFFRLDGWDSTMGVKDQSQSRKENSTHKG
ncbi:MAG: SDR family NAD(P)-dependent oxidoreductase, partial [Anaerolineales bacterium]